MRTRRAVTILICGAVVGWVGSQAAVAEGPLSWDEYRLGQFIASRGPTPAEILALDDNGEILLACREGCTVAGLEGVGVRAMASQLELLRTWALLESDGAAYRTAIPILDGEDAGYLEELADGVAGKLVEATGDDVAELIAALGADGMEAHAWTVMFAYVLDGAVWEFLDELGTIGSRDVANRGAPWGGEVWAYVAGGEPSTSTIRRASVAIRASWVEALQSRMLSLLRGPAGVNALFAALEKGDVESPDVRAHLQEHGILGPERQITVPFIVESRDNAVFAVCERLTERVATTVAKIDRAALVNDFGFANEAQAMIVAYHEVMWSLMEALVAGGALALPAAIADPETAAPQDLGKLVIMERRTARESSGADTRDPKRDEE